MHKRKWETLDFIWVISGILLVLGIASIFFPGPYEICEKNEYTNAKECTNSYSFTAYRLWIATKFIQSYNGAFAVLFAAILTLITFLQLRNNRRQVGHFEIKERAYVKMSHARSVRLSNAKARVKIEVSNRGQTPANVRGVLLKPIFLDDIALLPKAPEYCGETARGSAFLVKGDKFYTNRNFDMPDGHYERLQQRTLQMCLIGYVDYIDKFGERHRSGYARRYSLIRDLDDRTNLVFVGGAAYNYDRVRLPGEGSDWD